MGSVSVDELMSPRSELLQLHLKTDCPPDNYRLQTSCPSVINHDVSCSMRLMLLSHLVLHLYQRNLRGGEGAGWNGWRKMSGV